MSNAGFFLRPSQRHTCFVALAIALLALAGCRQTGARPSALPTPTSTISPTVESAGNSLEPTATPGPLELIVWSPFSLSPQPGADGAGLLTQQIAAFEARNPSIGIRYEPKASQGRSGLLQFLRAASTVAPRTLPDVVILPSDDFNDAARAGLLYPLEPLVAPEIVQALYPFARRDGRVGEHLVGLPLLVSVEHLVYRPQGALPPPLTWEQFLTGQQRFLFAAGDNGAGVGNAFLLQLLSLEPEPLASGELPDFETVERVLVFYDEGRARGLIPAEVVSMTQPVELWKRFNAGGAELLEADARTFLIERERVSGLAYAPVPTSDGRPTTVAAGYLVAVTAQDPARQRAAATYIEWLLAPEQLGPYAATVRWLPVRPDALESAIVDAGYRGFADMMLSHAWLRPSGPQWTAASKAMQEQVRAVLEDRSTPAQAVEALQENLRP